MCIFAGGSGLGFCRHGSYSLKETHKKTKAEKKKLICFLSFVCTGIGSFVFMAFHDCIRIRNFCHSV